MPAPERKTLHRWQAAPGKEEKKRGKFIAVELRRQPTGRKLGRSISISRPTKRSEQIARLAGQALAGRKSIF